MKIHSSREIEYFVETHLCKLVCDAPIACISLIIYVGACYTRGAIYMIVRPDGVSGYP